MEMTRWVVPAPAVHPPDNTLCYLVPVFSALGLSVPAQFLSIGFTAVVGSLLCAGTYATELTNRICLAVAIVAYCLLLRCSPDSRSPRLHTTHDA